MVEGITGTITSAANNGTGATIAVGACITVHGFLYYKIHELKKDLQRLRDEVSEISKAFYILSGGIDAMGPEFYFRQRKESPPH